MLGVQAVQTRIELRADDAARSRFSAGVVRRIECRPPKSHNPPALKYWFREGFEVVNRQLPCLKSLWGSLMAKTLSCDMGANWCKSRRVHAAAVPSLVVKRKR